MARLDIIQDSLVVDILILLHNLAPFLWLLPVFWNTKLQNNQIHAFWGVLAHLLFWTTASMQLHQNILKTVFVGVILLLLFFVMPVISIKLAGVAHQKVNTFSTFPSLAISHACFPPLLSLPFHLFVHFPFHFSTSPSLLISFHSIHHIFLFLSLPSLPLLYSLWWDPTEERHENNLSMTDLFSYCSFFCGRAWSLAMFSWAMLCLFSSLLISSLSIYFFYSHPLFPSFFVYSLLYFFSPFSSFLSFLLCPSLTIFAWFSIPFPFIFYHPFPSLFLFSHLFTLVTFIIIYCDTDSEVLPTWPW